MQSQIVNKSISSFRQIFVIFNMSSGKSVFSDSLERVRKLVKGLRQAFNQSEVHFVGVDTFAEARLQTKLACDMQVDLLIVAGGDGTLREVTDMVCKSAYQPKMAIFPAGTVNLVAHELDMPVDINAWIKRLMRGEEKVVFPMYANEQLFLSVAGVGFDSYIVSQVKPAEKQQFGRAAYMLHASSLLKKEWQKQFTLTIDEQELAEPVVSVLILHGKYYAGTYNVIPEARLSDDFFYVCTLSSAVAKDLMKYALLLVTGSLLTDSDIKVYKAKKLKIASSTPEFPVQVDGDILGNLPVEIKIAERPLCFIK